MSQDAEHLQLLAIFHYVVAGLGALCSFFPLLYTIVGAIFIGAARHGTTKPGRSAARIPRLDLCRAWLGIVFDRDRHVSLHPIDRTIARVAQALQFRVRDGLHRMPVCSVWNCS